MRTVGILDRKGLYWRNLSCTTPNDLAEIRLSFPSASRWVRHSYLSKGLRLIPYTCGSSPLAFRWYPLPLVPRYFQSQTQRVQHERFCARKPGAYLLALKFHPRRKTKPSPSSSSDLLAINEIPNLQIKELKTNLIIGIKITTKQSKMGSDKQNLISRVRWH